MSSDTNYSGAPKLLGLIQKLLQIGHIVAYSLLLDGGIIEQSIDIIGVHPPDIFVRVLLLPVRFLQFVHVLLDLLDLAHLGIERLEVGFRGSVEFEQVGVFHTLYCLLELFTADHTVAVDVDLVKYLHGIGFGYGDRLVHAEALRCGADGSTGKVLPDLTGRERTSLPTCGSGNANREEHIEFGGEGLW